MSRNNCNSRRKPSLRRPALVAAIALGLSGQAFAIEFTWGENLTGTFDTTVSYGVQVRVQDIDPNLIGKGNILPTAFQLPNAQQRLLPGRWSVNSDDGNRKYEAGEITGTCPAFSGGTTTGSSPDGVIGSGCHSVCA